MIRTNGPKFFFNPRIIIPFLSISFMTCVLLYEDHANAAQVQPSTSQQVQDVQIQTMQRQVDINTGRISALELQGSGNAQQNSRDLKLLELRITNLEQSFYLWKGIVYGFASLSTLLEILQAMGLLNYKVRRKNLVAQED